jgi:hypothetical protein
MRDLSIDREISIGDYGLTNGTLASAVLMGAVSRYVPGVLGSEQSLEHDHFNDGLLSFLQYTRPAMFMNVAVLEVLLSGSHDDITSWRRNQMIERTQQRCPDLLKRRNLKKMSQDIMESVSIDQQKPDRHVFEVGDGVVVHTIVREGGKERVQLFSGMVIARHGSGIGKTFTVRRVASGEGEDRW